MDNEAFVQNIKFYCERKGKKPTVACGESGVGTSFITDLNRGRTPSVAKVQLLAKYLGVTTSALLGEIDDSALVSNSALELLYVQLNAEGQAKLLDIADDMVSSGKYRNKNAASVG